MAVYVLSNTGGLISAGDVADSITTQSPALGAATILGNGGNDTITTSPLITQVQLAIRSRVALVLTPFPLLPVPSVLVKPPFTWCRLHRHHRRAAELKTQAGADVVSAEGTTITTLAVGAGNDSVLFTGSVTNLGLGGGADQLTGSLSLATGSDIKLGDGNDTINLVLSGQGTGALYGDQQATSAGADKITVEIVGIAGQTIKGAGGNDTISLISAGASSFIAGNAGADVINVSGALQDNISTEVVQATTPFSWWSSGRHFC